MIVCFKMPTGTETTVLPYICFAKCFKCAGGENTGCCNHVCDIVIGMMQFQMGIIGVGQYNGGDRAWGHGRLLADMPSLPSHQIALLFPSQHALRIYPGLKTNFTTLRPTIGRYIQFIQKYGETDLPITVNELHYDVREPTDPPIRHAEPLPDWDFEESYKQGKLVLECE